MRLSACLLLSAQLLFARPNGTGHSPVVLELNRGQADPGAQFLARAPGYLLLLQKYAGAIYCTAAECIPMNLAGAADSAPSGERKLASIAHYYTGQRSLRNIPQYARVRYPQVYPGIDLLWQRRNSGVEFSFALEPGAMPEQIQFRFGGSATVRLDADGTLLAGPLRLAPPVAYQHTGAHWQSVPIRYHLAAATVSFALGPYDRSQGLYIDPLVTFATYFGGSGFDAAYAVAVDSAGSIYIAGETASANFPLAGQRPMNRDAFVSKLSAGAASVVYTTILSASGNDSVRALAVDTAGHVYLAGVTAGGNFPATPGALQPAAGGLEDGFVARLNASGRLVWATYLGAGGTDLISGMAVDSGGNAYITGYTGSTQFPTTAGAPQARYRGGFFDAFVAKLNPAGNTLLYSTLLGGSGNDTARSVAVDALGNACIAGASDSPDFPVRSALQASLAGGSDAFVGCLAASGTTWKFLTYLGGAGMDEAGAIATDGDGNLYLTGTTFSNNFPITSAALQGVRRGDYDAFVTKLNASGSALVFSTLLGGTGSETGSAIAVDSSGQPWVAGYTSSPDFPLRNAWQEYRGSFDCFVARANASGAALLFSSHLGGAGDDRCAGIALGSGNTAYVTGFTAGGGFPATPGALQSRPGGGADAFLVHIDPSRGPTTAGDLDGDGHPDLIWQEDASRRVAAWYLTGAEGNLFRDSAWIYANPIPGWTIAAVTDLDRDGYPDIIWQQDGTHRVAVWYLGGPQGNTFRSFAWIDSNGIPGWTVVAAADLNGDGHPDLIWQHDVTHYVAVWYMGGALGNVFQAFGWLNPDDLSAWRLAAVADLNRDGKPDLIWEELATRRVAAWYMQGAGGNIFQAFRWVGSTGLPESSVAGASDLNRDGYPDLIWQNDATRDLSIWYLTGPYGNETQSYGAINASGLPGWRAVAPR